jgi:hypothetical protein
VTLASFSMTQRSDHRGPAHQRGLFQHLLRSPRGRPPTAAGQPKTPTRTAKRAPPRWRAAPRVFVVAGVALFHGRRSSVSDLWGTTSRKRCAHHRALSNGRHLAGDPRGLWRAQRGCDGLSGTALGCIVAADPSDQLAQYRSRGSEPRVSSPSGGSNVSARPTTPRAVAV